ncbi:MAG TPA: pantoate--beta-alanine ligase [Syntrophales bacterium]|nr:pantoate--beta-alanine ligase [Syntrophales bacterium]
MRAMRIIQPVKEMQDFCDHNRKTGKIISLVPTMGYLHEGHLNLMREGKKRGDCLVVSIYVNPTQFGAGEDFEKYPRDIERDAEMAESVGVDVIFSPASSDMYPEHYQTFVNVETITQNLCGLSRPGHFRGVATVCCKLFNIVKPHVAIFGQKDFQQLAVIRRMVEDLNMDVEILGMPTVREADGLAMSSRNTYLHDKEREAALILSRSLLHAKKLYDDGQRDTAGILKVVTDSLEASPLVRLEYAKICDVVTLKDVTYLGNATVLALAVKVGATRLIDNYVFGDTFDVSC